MTKLKHNYFSICLFQFSTYFEQPRTHHQENKLYQYNIWYVSICVGDRLLCRSGRSFPTCILDGQSDTYQISNWYNWFSWWWARGCSKHVDNWNKQIKRKRILRQVGYLQEWCGKFIKSYCNLVWIHYAGCWNMMKSVMLVSLFLYSPVPSLWSENLSS
jgi:hypothetical protein